MCQTIVLVGRHQPKQKGFNIACQLLEDENNTHTDETLSFCLSITFITEGGNCLLFISLNAKFDK